MGEYTDCHVINGDSILLKKAARGISKGLWNCPGGRVEEGETPEQNAIREVYEETGLKVSNLFYHGKLNCNMPDGKVINIHLFSTGKFEGAVKSSGEGEVRWFKQNEIPYSEMWNDDIYWIGRMLNRERFDGEFYFDSNNKVIKHDIHERRS